MPAKKPLIIWKNVFEFDRDKPVKVYRNLHKKLWTVKQKRVVFYTDRILLRDCEFRVGNAGRQRVIQTKKKNVHAYVVGHMSSTQELLELQRNTLGPNECSFYDTVTYNPYENSSFVTDEGKPIRAAKFVDLDIYEKDKVLAIQFGEKK